MTFTTETAKNGASKDYAYYDKYYNHACEVCIPIVLKTPIYIEPVVIEKEPKCLEKKY